MDTINELHNPSGSIIENGKFGMVRKVVFTEEEYKENLELYSRIRRQYAGTVSLLADINMAIRDQETKDNITRVVEDWCDVTGWGYKQILDRIELIPPHQKQTESIPDKFGIDVE